MRVVSIGAILTFKVVFTPLEYIPTIPPLSSYFINICFVLFKQREGPQPCYTTPRQLTIYVYTS